MLDDFAIVRKSLGARVFATATTVAMVGIAAALMIVLLSLKDSGRKAFERGTGNAHLLVSNEPSALVSVLNSVYYANAPRNAMPMAWVEELRETYPLAWAIPTAQGDSWYGRPVVGTTRSFFEDFEPVRGEPWVFERGELFDEPFEMVVGADVASSFAVDIGDVMYVTHGSSDRSGRPADPGAHVHREFAFRVVGILGPTGSAHDRALFTDIVGMWILHAHDRRLAELGAGIELTTADDLIEGDRVATGLYVRVLTRPGFDASAQVQPVFNALRSDARLTPAQPAEEVRTLFEIVSNIDQLFIGLAAVVLVSSGVSIMLAMYDSMAQRRRQIAVLRVLGCSRGRVFGLVMTESAMVGLAGGVVGALLAVIGTRIVTRVLEARVGLVVEAGIEPRLALTVVTATLTLAVLAGLAPAVMAYRTEVSRNLRPTA